MCCCKSSYKKVARRIAAERASRRIAADAGQTRGTTDAAEPPSYEAATHGQPPPAPYEETKRKDEGGPIGVSEPDKKHVF